MNSVKSVGSGRQFLLSGMSLAIMSLMSAGAASAQEAPAAAGEPQQAVCPTPADPNAACATEETASTETGGAIEEIIVRGVRASVTNAISIKQNSAEITDSIVAEDIGKLPDNSVAAALQRVTGVQVTRSAGEVGTVLIRGLPNVVTTLNGRNVFTTTGRGVALADIPADLLQRVDVYKTSSAEHIEGGVAGMIDVRLRRPFDFDEGFTAAGGIRGVYSDQSEETDPIGSLTLSNRWQTAVGEMGAMASVSYQDRRYLESNTFNGTYDLVSNPLDSNQLVYRPFVIGSIYSAGDRNRTATNLSYQWRPNDRLELYAEGYYVGFENKSQLNYWIPLPGLAGSGNTTRFTLKPGSTRTQRIDVDGDGIAEEVQTSVAQGLQATDMFTLTSNQAYFDSSDTYQAAVGGKWEGDNVTLTSELAYTFSKADARSFILDTAFNAPVMTIDLSNDGASDALVTNADGSFFDVTDSSHYFLNQYFDSFSQQEGDDVSWKTDAKFDVDFAAIKSFETGFRVSLRTATNEAADTGGRYNISGETVFVDDLPGLADVTPSGMLDGERPVSTPRWMVANREYLLNNSAAIREAMGYDTAPPELDPALFFDDEENTYAAYGQFNYELSLGSLPLDGIVGVRVVQADSTLQGTRTETDGSQSPLTIDKSETDVLPNLSARLTLRDDLFLRGALGMSVTRPNFADLNPQLALYAAGDTLPARGEGGNPDLDSVESTNIDTSLEWYFQKGALLAATLFYRDIDGYIQSYADDETIGDTVYSVTRPRNTRNGELKGLELAYTQFFDFLPGWLSGFGTQLNATFISAETDAPPEMIDGELRSPGKQDLVNVSDRSYNAILIYELDAFSARLAYNWRSEYAIGFNSTGAQPGGIYVKDTDTLDYLMSYDVTDRLTVSMEATNLLDSVTENYFGGESSQDAYLFPRDVASTERTFSLGLRFRL